MTLFQKIKLILKSVREYKKYAIITPLFMLGEILIESLLPFLMSNLIDMISKLESISEFFTPKQTTNLPFQIDSNRLPTHIAFIIDGNALLIIWCFRWQIRC